MAALMDGSISAVEEKPTITAKSKDILRLLGSSTTSTPNYPDETPRHFHAGLKILNTPDAKGRGVFATENMSRGTLLEISPVLVVPPEQYSIPGQAAVSQSVLKDYVFVWNRKGAMALALGLGKSSILRLGMSHSFIPPSCRLYIQSRQIPKRLFYSRQGYSDNTIYAL